MRTFASAFTLPSGGNWWNNSATLTTKSKWNTKLTSEGVIVDARNTAHKQELLNAGDNKLNYTIHNEMRSTLIPGKSVNNANADMEEIDTLFTSTRRFEDAFHYPTSIMGSFNQYKFIFAHQIEDIYDKNVAVSGDKEGEVSDADIKSDKVKKIAVADTVGWEAVPSLFNPYMSIRVAGITSNIPIYNNVDQYNSITSHVENLNMDDVANGKSQKDVKVEKSYYQTSISHSADPDFTDCSIKTLVRLSNDFSDNGKQASKELGQERFKYADFMYCKDVGRISNNYLITLRRFAYPIGDDITCKNVQVPPDIGRMLCYIGEDNKLDDILKYQYNATWKELNAKIEEKQSQEDDQARGLIGSIVNLSNPQYIKQVAAGTAGSGNSILGYIANKTPLGAVFDNKGTYENSPALGNYDQNRVYEPQDTIQDTHIYEGKLKFQHEFTLVFNYEMRAYDNINPRTAFLDLLANIHAVTFRTGSFWAGQQKIVGASRNPEGWAKANAFIDKAWDKLGGFCEGLLTGNIDWQSVWGSISSTFGKAVEKAKEVVDEAKSQGKSTAAFVGSKIVNEWKSRGFGDAFKGMLKNKLGRPALYAFSSLLPGGPQAFHHVTIGNPRAPIMSIGNLIITNTTVQHYGPLGIDDFPTGLKVTVSLKHAKSRDITNIQHMYTGAKHTISAGFPGIRKLEKYYDFGNMSLESGDEEHNKVYYATNGADEIKMEYDYDNKTWMMYETKVTVDSKGNVSKQNIPHKMGDISDPTGTFNTQLQNRSSKQLGWGEGTITNISHYNSLQREGDNDARYNTIVGKFGTNNIGQIVANAALFTRKT